MSGVVAVAFLFVLCLGCIFVAQYRWYRERLSIFYSDGDVCLPRFAHQHLMRLCYQQDPNVVHHHARCQVWAEVVYECSKTVTIPFYINKVSIDRCFLRLIAERKN